MDGRMAVLFAVISAFEGINSDVEVAPPPPQLAVSLGNASVNKVKGNKELGVSYFFGKKYGPWQPVISSSITAKGGAWVGFGGNINLQKGPVYFSSYFIPGLYSKGNDVELGSIIEFKSGIEVGYEFDNSSKISVGYDHRSNADLGFTNPGMESIYLRYYHSF